MTNQEHLIIANQELLLYNKEKEKSIQDLVDTNKELRFQKKEKNKRTAELIFADKKLIYQKKKKDKRTTKLSIANKELAFQNEEREKLAAKLTIANKELLFQNLQKETRAEELIVANKALLIQTQLQSRQAAELEEALKELESFSYSVSHDLRSPLRAINGFTQVLVEDYMEQLDEDAKDLLNDIIANSNKMGELIDNLLEFSRIGKQHISMVDVNMNQLLSMVITEQKQLEPKRKFNIIVKDLKNVMGDRSMLKQVLINLVSNAFKYTGKKEETIIEIGSYIENEHCVYYVKDNGAGFDMHYYDKLFGVFQRLHSSNEFDGTGVGLAIVQKIVTKHHGKVWAESKVGKGACFYISLPDPPVGN